MTTRFLVFPGQGSQYAGMGKEWFNNFKSAQLAFEEASDFSGLNLKRLCFDSTDYDLKATEITQPAILTVTVAIYRALKEQFEINESQHIFAGHSLGEYSALVCMGALEVGPAAKLVMHRGQYMQQAVPKDTGSMAAVIFKPKVDGAPRALALCEIIRKDINAKLWVANYNSPEQIVISGEKDGIVKALQIATLPPTEARKIVELPVSAPFHCGLMRPAAEKLKPELESAAWKTSTDRKYIANVDASLSNLAQKSEIARKLEEQVTASVRWVESVQTAINAGAVDAIEIGPGKVLSGLIRRIDSGGKTLECKNIDTWKEFKDAGFTV